VTPNNCDKCLSDLTYSDEWDAMYCNSCNEWKEACCGVTTNEPIMECFFECWKRPERPNEK
jgi:hypothetical protein